MDYPVQMPSASERLVPELDPESALETAIRQAQTHLLGLQSPEGYWLGKLEADASVAAGYLAVMRFMEQPVAAEHTRKIVSYCRTRRSADGGWPAFYDGPPDLNVSIQVYFGLKLAGVPADDDWMEQARRCILDLGGIGRASVFTKIWLALFGQFDWQDTPSVPPEIIFLPNWFYLNIYEFASWSRQTIMALSIVTTLRPVCRVSTTESVEELYREPAGQRRYPLGVIGKRLNWRSFFLVVDRLIKVYERSPVRPGRRRALETVQKWIADRQEADGGWGGIMLPWIYSLFAFKALGHGLDHRLIATGLAGLATFLVETETELLLQPAMSPVWDTAWAAVALEETGLSADHPGLQRAGRWLLTQEVRLAGDWRVKNPHTSPGGWAFEFENDLYPDMDDSALVPRALLGLRLDPGEELKKHEAIHRARSWVLDMQSRDGGWAAFDRDNDKQALYYVPFSEFMSPLDPTCADVTAHVVELLALLKTAEGSAGSSQPDSDARSSALARAVEYLVRSQEPDGAWYGRWGVNYLYGTALALTALAAAGESFSLPGMQRAVDWLISRQNPDGGWGETCETYVTPALRGKGSSTASQTAWVLIGLAAALNAGLPPPTGEVAADQVAAAVRGGIGYLLSTQLPDGSWAEANFTGGGFPKVFYLKYELYKIYFPLLALGRCRTLKLGPGGG